MSSTPAESSRPKKRPSPTNDENIKPNMHSGNLSPSKLLSPLHSFKKIFWREEEEDETSLTTKKPKRDELLSPNSSNPNAFITSSPNPKRPLNAKAPQTPCVVVAQEAPVSSPSRRLSRNLAEEFEEESPSKYDDSEPKKKTLLNTLFSPVFTLFNGKQPASKSEKNSPSKNELSSDETLEPTILFQKETSEEINYALYKQYGEYIVNVQEELAKEGISQLENNEEDIECEEEEEYEDDDLDFDPFQFIAQLPDVSELERRPILLPPKPKNGPKITLVLDLDETLVHCSTEQLPGAELTFPVLYGGKEYQVFVRRRPHFEEFLKRVSQLFEVVVFTASQEVYASKLLDLIDTENKYVHHRLYRDSCVCVEGNYLKDLSVLGRDLSNVVIVDNSPQAFGFQLENGIPIESWFEDLQDTELLKLIPFLEGLLTVKDVRPLVREKFKLYEKVDVYRPNDGHP